MKKTMALALSAMLLAAIAVGPAEAGKKKKKKKKPPVVQEQSGTIAVPARHPDGCYTGLGRHVWSLGEETTNGVVGYVFDIDEKTWGKPFTLDVTGGQGYLDLDITFYMGPFADRDAFINDPAPAAPPSQSYEIHQEGGEEGTVPEYAVKAIACIYASEAGAGVEASFDYKGGDI